MKVHLWVVIAGAALLFAQTGEQKKQAPPAKQESGPAPLFTGMVGIRSSQKTKESATLGFNGIDRSGKVEARMFAASPSAAEQERVKKMAAERPSEAELNAFLAEGGLNKK